MSAQRLPGVFAGLAVALAVLAGCTGTNGGTPTQAATIAGTGTGTAAGTATASPTRQDSFGASAKYHPRGFALAKGAVIRPPSVSDPNSHPTVDVQVGDVLTLTANEWLPDNPADPAELIDGSVVLAAVGGEGLTYQAVEVGSAVLPMGPVGHPGGCDQPGKNCTDATPPPSIFIAVGAR